MIVLGIETTSKIGSLCLVEGRNVLNQEIISDNYHHSSGIVPALKRLLKNTGLASKDISAAGVSTGPGSFTGIRIGIAFARGLAMSLGIPVVGIVTFHSILFSYRNEKGSYCAVLDAGRENVYAGIFKIENNTLTKVKEYFCGNTDKLLEYNRDEAVFVGHKQVEKTISEACSIALLSYETLSINKKIEDPVPLYVRPSYVDRG